jgi:hypothetical protein
METHICPVCREVLATPSVLVDDGLKVPCYRCGTFWCTGTAVPLLLDEASQTESGKRRLGPNHSRRRANASGWVRENPGYRITTSDIDRLASLPTPTFHQRADKLLVELERGTPCAGDIVQVGAPTWAGAAWCAHDGEFGEVLLYLEKEGRIQRAVMPGGSYTSVVIKPAGWAHLESLRSRGAATSQVFVAMNLHPSLEALWLEGIKPGIGKAGYEALRIDRKEHLNKIDDEIVAEIRRSRFVVADLTNHRQSVYFEVGYAMGLGMKVIWTCRKNQIKKLHFDIRQYPCIPWQEPKDLVLPLKNRILTNFDPGPIEWPD